MIFNQQTCGGSSPVLQNKTVTPTNSQQVVSADSGYDGLDEVTVEGVVCTNLTAAHIKDGVVVKIGTATDDDSVTSVTGEYQGGGGGGELEIVLAIAKYDSSSGKIVTVGSVTFSTLPRAVFGSLSESIFETSLPYRSIQSLHYYNGSGNVYTFTSNSSACYSSNPSISGIELTGDGKLAITVALGANFNNKTIALRCVM